MVTNEQVKRLRKLLAVGTPLCVAAARSGMSEKTARRWRSGALPGEAERKRGWRTRADPFAEDWPEIVQQLRGAPGLEALTLFQELQRRRPGRYQEGQLRTLQRRVREWRALEGEPKDVKFRQEIEPGRQGQSDFTSTTELGVTIGGEAFEHLIYHFQLPYSNWEYVEVAFSESFEALSRGFQNAVFALGAVPGEHRTDNLSAATHKLRSEAGRDFNERYRALLAHYGVEPTKNNPGKGHENGDVEQAHHRFKRRLEQDLLLRGSRDFADREEYERQLQATAARLNRGREARLSEEWPKLKELPAAKQESWTEVWVRVGPGSTIRVGKNTYSVPSQLIGHKVDVRIHADLLEVRYGEKIVERLERLRGQGGHNINYRHVVHALVRKPGAFRRYCYRDALFPSVVYRRAFDALRERFGDRGDGEYLKILHRAAMTSESEVAAALELLLEGSRVPELTAVRELTEERVVAVPELQVTAPDLGAYDRLLSRAEVA